MFGIITALISGALMSIQGVFNTNVTKGAGIWAANSWVQFSALFVCLVAWLCSGRESFAKLLEIQPKYMLTGGIIGAFITYTVIRSMGELGPARAALLIVVSQLLAAYLIELFGLFGVERAAFEWRKLFGMALAAVGIIIFKM